MKYSIPFLSWTGKASLSVEIDVYYETSSEGTKLGAAVRVALSAGANLSGADLSGANLSGADLSGASLSGADLSRANLSRANLSGASLSYASLSYASLSGADLSGANLSRANLSRANLSYASLSYASLSGADLSGANLSRANLSRANLSGASLYVGGMRSDGYAFFGIVEKSGQLMIRAGCRYFTPKEARAHWKKTRAKSRLGAESLTLVDHIEALHKIAKKKFAA